MVRLLISAALLAVLALPARAECYLDYKAKRDDPLRLHYGVALVPDDLCGDFKGAHDLLEQRLGQAGWRLIKILGFFGPEGLSERKESAGEHFLRY
ncbi:MAG: hypothetical protein ACT4N9_07240 [Paracoccaceae bacterium]